MKKIVAVIAPTFNEEESIVTFLTAVARQQKNLKGYQLEIIISDSHSKDATAARVRKLARKNSLIHLVDSAPGPGRLGVGLASGLDYAVTKLHADYLVTLEADLTEDPALIAKFVVKLNKYDVVIGSRYVKGGQILNWTWWRRSLSLLANLFLGLMAFRLDIHEYTNLYRGFRVAVWQKIRPEVSRHRGWLFVPAFVFESLENNFRVVEEPIIYADRFGGRSKMHTISYSRNLLRYALAFRLRKIFRR